MKALLHDDRFYPVHLNASMYFLYFYRADPDFWIGSKFKLKSISREILA